MSENRPSWLPDWRGLTGYPDPNTSFGTTSRYRWRWEFQRRDPDYHRDWAERADRPADFWRRRYGLQAPLDPGSPTASFAADRRYLIVPPQTTDQRCEITIRGGTALVEFDLTRPLQPQVKSAEFQLRAWTLNESDLKRPRVKDGFVVKRSRRGKGFQLRPKDWLRYLRLLDADASGACKEEIGRALYPNLTNESEQRMLDTHLRDDRSAVRKLLKDRKYTLF